MYQGGDGVKRQRIDCAYLPHMMADTGDDGASVSTLDNNAEHFVRMMHGLNKLKKERVLCDVTLIAEGERFDVHKVILVSCSDYFRSMFTSGMKESSQSEIELKGITSKGLEKVIEVIYTSTTTLDGDDIFDVIGAATHLQATPVIEFCERNFLSGMTTSNFYDFITTAKLYSMSSALRQIDMFIADNLLAIARDGTLSLLTYEQILHCLRCGTLNLHEIDIFQVAWDWLRSDPAVEQHAVQLMSHVRFALIGPSDLVDRVQAVESMTRCPELRDMVFAALNYHVVPHAQPLRQSTSTTPRACTERLVSVGGREIHPHPGLHDELVVFGEDIASASTVGGRRSEITTLPNPLSHMQVVVFGGFLYVLGGCATQCAHGESAVNMVHRYDPRFNSWYQVTSMMSRRAYFFAGAVGNHLYAIGGKFKDGSLSSAECYDPELNRWELIPPMPSAYHSHAGAVHAGRIFISGGYSNNHFTPDLQRFDPVAGQWDDMAPMLTPRGWHVMAAVGERLIVAGGCNLNTSQQALPVLQAEAYDPLSDQWTLIAPLAVSHKEASCVVYRNQIYILGGYNVQTKTGQRAVSRYDAEAGAWEQIGALPFSQTGVGYCVLPLPTYNLDLFD